MSLIKAILILHCAIESKKVIVITGVNSVLDGLSFEAQTYDAAFWLLIVCKALVLRMDDS